MIFKVLLAMFILSDYIAMAQISKKYLALGDSYTIGESVREEERWPVQLVQSLSARGESFRAPDIIATTGWRTDDLNKAIQQQNPAKDYHLVSLLIGVNNQYQGRSANDYALEFEALLEMAIGFAGGDKTKVFVVSIPDYGFTPFGKEKQQQISREIDEFNNINRTITEKFGVQYFNITPISRKGLDDPSLVATDGLHPSGKMYTEWVDLMIDNKYFQTMQFDVEYSYSDGSGNTYVITRQHVYYHPITPERSSSGMYSGGTEKKVAITDDQFRKIEILFNKGFENTNAHYPDRAKMTGLIKMKSSGKSTTVVLKRDSQEKHQLETFLKDVLK